MRYLENIVHENAMKAICKHLRYARIVQKFGRQFITDFWPLRTLKIFCTKNVKTAVPQGSFLFFHSENLHKPPCRYGPLHFLPQNVKKTLSKNKNNKKKNNIKNHRAFERDIFFHSKNPSELPCCCGPLPLSPKTSKKHRAFERFFFCSLQKSPKTTVPLWAFAFFTPKRQKNTVHSTSVFFFGSLETPPKSTVSIWNLTICFY